jgi:hypothetical protein
MASSENGGSGGKAQTNCLGRMGTGRVRGFGLGGSGCGAGLAAAFGAGALGRGLAVGNADFGRPAAPVGFERAGLAGFVVEPAGGVCGGRAGGPFGAGVGGGWGGTP